VSHCSSVGAVEAAMAYKNDNESDVILLENSKEATRLDELVTELAVGFPDTQGISRTA
jgi:hypothetical protein